MLQESSNIGNDQRDSRLLSVQLMLDQGQDYEQVAKILSLDEQAIRQYMVAFQQEPSIVDYVRETNPPEIISTQSTNESVETAGQQQANGEPQCMVACGSCRKACPNNACP